MVRSWCSSIFHLGGEGGIFNGWQQKNLVSSLESAEMVASV